MAGERSEPVLISAAGEIFEDFRAEMANFMSKWGTLVVYGKKQSCQEFRAEHRYTFQFHSSQQEGGATPPGFLNAGSGGARVACPHPPVEEPSECRGGCVGMGVVTV